MDQPVIVTLTTETQSGSAIVKVTVSFSAPTLEMALHMVRVATDGAPLFKNPLEEGNS